MKINDGPHDTLASYLMDDGQDSDKLLFGNDYRSWSHADFKAYLDLSTNLWKF